jgi:hypothetical protein
MLLHCGLLELDRQLRLSPVLSPTRLCSSITDSLSGRSIVKARLDEAESSRTCVLSCLIRTTKKEGRRFHGSAFRPLSNGRLH